MPSAAAAACGKSARTPSLSPRPTSYTGGTLITGGTLSISANENLGEPAALSPSTRTVLDHRRAGDHLDLVARHALHRHRRRRRGAPGGPGDDPDGCRPPQRHGQLTKAGTGTLTLSRMPGVILPAISPLPTEPSSAQPPAGARPASSPGQCPAQHQREQRRHPAVQTHTTFRNAGATPRLTITSTVVRDQRPASFGSHSPRSARELTKRQPSPPPAEPMPRFQAYQLKAPSPPAACLHQHTGHPAPFNGVHLFSTTTFT